MRRKREEEEEELIDESRFNSRELVDESKHKHNFAKGVQKRFSNGNKVSKILRRNL